MGNFDTSTPVGTNPMSIVDDNIRELKTAMQESLRGGAAEGVEAIFPGSAPSTAPVFRVRGRKGTTGARPAAGQYGLYANETLATLQRDNGSAWEDIATLIPSGTKMVFYQASPPTGWTAVAVNDKFLRVVTAGGTGGSTGGTVAASTSLAHSHTVNAHTHSGPSHTHSVPNHTHELGYNAVLGQVTVNAAVFSIGAGTVIGSYSGGGSIAGRREHLNRTENDGSGTTGAEGTGNTGATSPGTDNGTLGAGAFAYADVVIATKD